FLLRPLGVDGERVVAEADRQRRGVEQVTGREAALARPVQPPRLLPGRGLVPGEAVVAPPDAELLPAAEVALGGLLTEGVPLQGRDAPLGDRPVATLPVHGAVPTPLRLGGDRDLRDAPFLRLHDEGARRVGVTGRVGLAARQEAGVAEDLPPVPEDG